MKLRSVLGTMAVLAVAAQAQSSSGDLTDPTLPATPPATSATPPPAPSVTVPPPAASTASSAPAAPDPHAVLELRALDKITGRASVVMAPLNVPVKFATLTIVARTCYSTPASETPETSAFVQIEDRRPDQPGRRVYSGWMYASSPGLNAMQHPLYDVWAISCKTNAPGQAPSVTAAAPVKPVSPNAGANEGMPELPEDAGQ